MTAAEHAAKAAELAERAEDHFVTAAHSTSAVGSATARARAHEELALAQVHATLATVPEYTELVAEPAFYPIPQTSYAEPAPVVVGSRVVWMQPRPGRRELLVMSHDTAGTVVAVRDLKADELTNDMPESKVNGRPTQWVRWDDGIVSEHLVDELRVVLGV